MAEFTKFCLSFYFHVSDFEGLRPDSAGKSFSEKFPAAKSVAMRSINVKAIASISVLGGLYCANNQLSFFLNVDADPGTIFLFKSGSTIITAVLLRFALKRAVSEMQWVAILMQVCGLVTVQFDPCKGRLDLPNYLYGWMAVGVFMTALNAVCNDKLLKDIPMSMHVQNMILYGGGCAMNVLCFNILPNPVGDGSIGFFEGYDNIWACLVILFNAMIGIAISAVYKYCDAVVKVRVRGAAAAAAAAAAPMPPVISNTLLLVNADVRHRRRHHCDGRLQRRLFGQDANHHGVHGCHRGYLLHMDLLQDRPRGQAEAARPASHRF